MEKWTTQQEESRNPHPHHNILNEQPCTPKQTSQGGSITGNVQQTQDNLETSAPAGYNGNMPGSGNEGTSKSSDLVQRTDQTTQGQKQ